MRVRTGEALSWPEWPTSAAGIETWNCGRMRRDLQIHVTQEKKIKGFKTLVDVGARESGASWSWKRERWGQKYLVVCVPARSGYGTILRGLPEGVSAMVQCMLCALSTQNWSRMVRSSSIPRTPASSDWSCVTSRTRPSRGLLEPWGQNLSLRGAVKAPHCLGLDVGLESGTCAISLLCWSALSTLCSERYWAERLASFEDLEGSCAQARHYVATSFILSRHGGGVVLIHFKLRLYQDPACPGV